VKRETRDKRVSKDTCTHIFIAGFVSITKGWKQLKCPSSDEWISMMMWYMHTMEYYAA
jgi:hypothetical protein